MSQYSLGHHTDHSPVGLGQYDGLGEYCGPHSASEVVLILVAPSKQFQLLQGDLFVVTT